MKKIIFFIAVSLLIASCEESLVDKGQEAPAETVGTWSSSELVPSAKRKLSKDCENLDVSTKGVSMDLLKIESNGTLFSVRDVASVSQPYTNYGTINAFWEITLNTKALEYYAEDSMKYAKEQGMSVAATGNIKISQDAKGVFLEMQIDLQLSKGSFKYEQKLPTRTYYKITEFGEKALLSKLQKCLNN